MDPLILKSLLQDVLSLTGEHLILVGISSAISIVLGVSVGILATRKPTVRRVSLTIANIFQTIPSLALFGFLLPLPFIGGIGMRTAIISLVLYSLLPILRNTVVGISNVDAGLRDAAVAMGMTDRQLLRLVELPLAAPTILAGIRIAVVTNIGTAVIAAVIGGGGLGVLIFRGVASVDTTQILAGAIPSTALALLADGGMGLLERKLARGKTMKQIGLLLAALAISSACGRKGAIIVASKNFTEQVILGEMAAQQLERKLHLPINRKLNLGGTLLAHQAIVKGQIDLYPEYTGTAGNSVLKQKVPSDPASAYMQVKQAYLERFKLVWLPPLGFNDTFAMVVRKPDAEHLPHPDLSHAATAGRSWRLGVGYEFLTRSDGLQSLDKTYPLQWQGTPKTMDLGLLYRALLQKQIDMAAGNSTDGLLSESSYAVLQDDKKAFPPYSACFVLRKQLLEEHPEVGTALTMLSNRISDEAMRSLNRQVDVEHKPVVRVVSDFLATTP